MATKQFNKIVCGNARPWLNLRTPEIVPNTAKNTNQTNANEKADFKKFDEERRKRKSKKRDHNLRNLTKNSKKEQTGQLLKSQSRCSINNRKVGNFIKNILSRKRSPATDTFQTKFGKSTRNYKIYCSRQFSTNASRSNLKSHRRNKSFFRFLGTGSNGDQFRSYSTKKPVAKHIANARIERTVHREPVDIPPAAMRMTAALKEDLMKINAEIKERIAVTGNMPTKMDQKKKEKNETKREPKVRTEKIKERVNNTEVKNKQRKLKAANKVANFERQAAFPGVSAVQSMLQRMGQGVESDRKNFERSTTVQGITGKDVNRSRIGPGIVAKSGNELFAAKPGIVKTTPQEHVSDEHARVAKKTAPRVAPGSSKRRLRKPVPPAGKVKQELPIKKQPNVEIKPAKKEPAAGGAKQKKLATNEKAKSTKHKKHARVSDALTPIQNAAAVSPTTYKKKPKIVKPTPEKKEETYTPGVSKTSATAYLTKGQPPYTNMRFNRSSYYQSPTAANMQASQNRKPKY